jgi:hypothetical protein
MLRLDTAAPEPFWETFREASKTDPAVRLQFRPIEPFMSLAAQMAVAEAIAGIDRETMPSKELLARIEQAFVTEMAVLGIQDWEGIGNKDGVAIKPDENAVRALMRSPALFQFVRDRYAREKLVEFAEKNASSPSQNGTGGAKIPAKAIATDASRSKGGRARNAPTSSTSRKRRRASASGMSSNPVADS